MSGKFTAGDFNGHRSKRGGTKQINRPHKGKHSSKRSISNANHGRVAEPQDVRSSAASRKDHRQDRRTAAQLRRKVCTYCFTVNMARLSKYSPVSRLSVWRHPSRA
jgi:hypothetical protein